MPACNGAAPPSGPVRHTVVILGGTGEGAALAARLADNPRLDVVTSLAGRTEAPAPVAGRVRIGGFGGPEGLADWLRTEKAAAVIDATHPFARTISENAAAACDAAGIPRLVTDRPAWEAGPGDDWHFFSTLTEAAEALPRFGRRAFLTTGRQSLPAFAHLAEMWFLVRLVDRPAGPLPLPVCQVVVGRGPFDVEAERALMADHGIDVLVTKASGGAATSAKLAAARALSLPVVMIARPEASGEAAAHTADDVESWLNRILGT